MAELLGHNSAINGIAWAPHSANHICTCGDDRQALIWDVTAPRSSPNGSAGAGSNIIEEPILAFGAEGEINSLQWDASHEDWVAICFGDTVQILKV